MSQVINLLWVRQHSQCLCGHSSLSGTDECNSVLICNAWERTGMEGSKSRSEIDKVSILVGPVSVGWLPASQLYQGWVKSVLCVEIMLGRKFLWLPHGHHTSPPHSPVFWNSRPVLFWALLWRAGLVKSFLWLCSHDCVLLNEKSAWFFILKQTFGAE